MANLSYKNDDQADERLDPATRAREIQAQEQQGAYDRDFDNVADNYDKSADSSQENENIQKTRQAEESPDNFRYTGSGQKQKSNSVTLRGRLKKAGPFGLIAGIVLSGFFGLSLLSPGLLLVQLKETMSDKFNDQLATMDVRTTKLLKKKLTATTTKGICNPVSIRCKYRTIGNRQLKKLEKAGFTVDGDRTSITGRMKPTSFEFNGNAIKASDLLTEAAKDPDLRSALRKGYNPKFAAFSDAIAAKVRAKLGLKKSKNITPSSDEKKMQKELKDNSSGKSIANQEPPRKIGDGDDATYEDSDGRSINKEEFDKYSSVSAELETRSSLSGVAKKAAVKSGIKGVLTSTAFGLGAADTLCTGWTVMRVASFAAKVFGARQLIRYSYQFMNTADSIKAGDATPEDTAYLSKILTTPNSEGRAATDSYGYKYAAYGDSFNVGNFDSSNKSGVLTDDAVNKNEIDNETAKYVNGQIIPGNVFASFVTKFNSVGGGGTKEGVDKFCKFEKSWTGQGILIGVSVLGAVAAIFSGGGSVSAGAAAQVGAMATLSVGLGLLTPKLLDLAKGTLITGDENGNEAGNAITSGMGAYNAQTSQARGLGVLNKEDAVAYTNTSREIAATYNQDEASELSPFDATSKNTFLGSIVSKLLPYTTKTSSVSGSLLSTGSLVSSSLSSVVNATSHASPAKSSDFNSCSDSEYTTRSLAADPFCNLRYGMSEKALAKDPEDVLDYMLRGNYITSDTDASPQGEYADYVTSCIERSTSIGDISEGSNGDECIQGGENDERNTMFRLFYIDTSIEDGMEYEETAPTGEGINVGTYNIRSSGLTGDIDTRSRYAADNIKQKAMDVVGLQEAEDNQVSKIQDNLADYNHKSVATRTIFWNASKFSLVKSDEFSVPKETVGQNRMLWVKLKAKTGGGEFYVIDIHPDVDSEANRTTTAEKVLSVMKDRMGDGLPIIIVGDMNSGDQYATNSDGRATGKQVNKVFMDSGLLTYTYQAAKTKTNADYKSFNGFDTLKSEGSGKDGVHLDQIYITTASNPTVNSWENVINDNTSKASDHNPVFVGLSIPGITVAETDETGATAGSNIQGDDYSKNCGKYATCSRQCVDFVLYRLVKHGVLKGIIALGNGKDVVNTLGRLGYKVDKTPAVNSVMSTSATSQPQFGHTAMVSAVNSDGSIVVEEYNFIHKKAYGKRTIPAAEIKAKNMTFAHTEVDYK